LAATAGPAGTGEDNEAMTITFVSTVTTEAQLDDDIRIIDGTTAAGNYTVTFGTSITEGNLSATQNGATVLPDLSAINLHGGVTLTINGAGNSLIGTNGTNTFRGLFAHSGNVSVDNLTIKSAVATGGAGGSSRNFNGGAGIAVNYGADIGYEPAADTADGTRQHDRRHT
jgi:hypothetical protein